MLINFSQQASQTQINFEKRKLINKAVTNSVRVSGCKIDYDLVDIRQIKKLINKGFSLSQIGEAIGEKMSTVRSILKHFKLNTKEGEIISRIDKNKVLELIKQGLSQKEIANIFGLKNSSALTPLMKQLGVRVSKTKVDNITKFELETLLNANKTLEDIANYFKVAPQYITKRFKELGLMFPRAIKMQQSVTKEELEIAVKRGLTKKEIAQRHGVTIQKISNLLDQYEIKTRFELENQNYKTVTLEALKEQLKCCKTKAQIARNLGVSDVYIAKQLKIHNLKLNQDAIPAKNEIIDALNNICSQVTIKKECVPEYGEKGDFSVIYLKNRLCDKLKIDRKTLDKLIKQHDLKEIMNISSKKVKKEINEIMKKKYFIWLAKKES